MLHASPATRETRVAFEPSKLAQASLEPRLSLPSGAEAGHGESSGLAVPAEELRHCRSAVCKTDQTRSRSATRGWARGSLQSAQTTVPVSQVASTTRPNAMRYQANGTKVWLDT